MSSSSRISISLKSVTRPYSLLPGRRAGLVLLGLCGLVRVSAFAGQTRLPALPTVSGGEGPSPAWRLGGPRRLSTRAQGCFRVPRRVHGQWACYQGRRGCRKTRTGGAGAKSPGAGAAFRPAAGAAHSQQACGGALVLRSARVPQPPARAPRLPLSSPGGCRAVPAEGRGPGTSCCTARLAWLPRNGCYTRAARRGSAPRHPLALWEAGVCCAASPHPVGVFLSISYSILPTPQEVSVNLPHLET